MFEYLKIKTKKIRHKICRFLAPKVFSYRYMQLGMLRPFTVFVKENLGKNLVGCEIGVFQGVNALTYFEELSIKKMYLIDPYIPYIQNGELIDKHHEENFKLAKDRLWKYRKKIVWVLKKSEDAINDIPDLDFCYIDGNHEYKYVKNDIDLYYRKIVYEGILGGHDFSLKFKGVIKAVFEFKEKYKYEIHGRLNDWWIIKR